MKIKSISIERALLPWLVLFASPALAGVQCDKPIWVDKQFTETCVPEKNPLHFSFEVRGKRYDEYAVVPENVTIRKNGEVTQQFPLEGYGWQIGFHDESGIAGAFGMTDINFDGYEDIEVLWGTGNANSSFVYWLYDPVTQSFDRQEDKNSLGGMFIEPDPKTKTIDVSSRGSCCDYLSERYHWVDTRLLVKSDTNVGILTLCSFPSLISGTVEGGDNCLKTYYCGTRTNQYDDAQNLISTTIHIPYDFCQGDSVLNLTKIEQIKEYIESLQGKNRKNMKINLVDSGALEITFDPPVKDETY